tara:strand:+ start:6384 stop:7019 length:636 start_codon:yes stop_codon:yes gene_type:complete
MADTTNLNDLPSNPSMGNANTNVVMTTNEMVQQQPIQQTESQQVPQQVPQQQQMAPMNALDNQKMMNQVVSGIQQASAAGVTQLASRDIPMETQNLTQDQEIKPNYLPHQDTKDYVFNSQMEDSILQNSQAKQNKQDSLEVMYEEMQIPIMIGLLYFVLQLPAVKKYFYQFFPSLYAEDGNPSLGGYVIHSVLFASLFYIMLKVIKHFSQL